MEDVNKKLEDLAKEIDATVEKFQTANAEEVKGLKAEFQTLTKQYNDLSAELDKKLQEFASYSDNLEEVFENREQIEISRYYERLSKPVLIAYEEFKDGQIYYRNPAKEKK